MIRPIVIRRALVADVSGHGLSSTMWNGIRYIFIMSRVTIFLLQRNVII